MNDVEAPARPPARTVRLASGRWAPGSPEAGDAGCICPVLDNCRGRRPPVPPNGWWFNANCPYHVGGDQ